MFSKSGENSLSGFTLIEILVGVVIFAITFGGLLVSFNASNIYISSSGRRLTAASFARSVLNELNNSVRADTWDDSNNPLFPVVDKAITLPGSFSQYSGSYTVVDGDDIDGDGQPDYRKVTITLNYPE